ncbi:hypothetical protein M501DRAFT_1018561 [Patellaria atrata CBS 101060]|uniref:C3H1-type domain-containing protein n=1 Tax=Patellaria atrata CBS 101060 TaxID=1346257 RepID=A0A9P4S649_9PEZI|nr:hypothetical protein M501DRAFT_1018561 [Patellaria atrata CBS 101060]
MLPDSEIDGLDAKLVALRHASSQQQDILQEFFQKYEELMKDYRQVRSDLEEEKESREKYKRLAKGSERNPFVLVLVDGDGYVFNDHLILAGPEGGINAGQLLNAAVRDSLARLDVDANECRIMVRVYANLSGLSRTLAKRKLIPTDKRSLAPFVAGFNRSQDFFDFVDADEKKEGADFKIRELFKLFADNSQCKHIFFAGCHDVGFLSLLTPFRNRIDKVTLIQGPYFSPEFISLNLRIEQYPTVFRQTRLDDGPQFPIATPSQSTIVTNGNPFGQISAAPVQRRNGDPTTPSAGLSGPPSEREGLIPVNKDGHRLDTFLPPASKNGRDTYYARTRRQKPCYDRVVAGKCAVSGCKLDHNSVGRDVILFMKHIRREKVCPFYGNCRSPSCGFAHVCPNAGKCTDCRWGQQWKNIHKIDKKVVRWVPITKAGTDGESCLLSGSGQKTTVPGNGQSSTVAGNGRKSSVSGNGPSSTAPRNGQSSAVPRSGASGSTPPGSIANGEAGETLRASLTSPSGGALI